MTGQRDIERILDAWFVDGPSVMPDRLYDAVLDQVERTQQHPLARIRLRLTEMRPRIRYLTVLAAALFVIATGFAVMSGAPNQLVNASPSAPAETAAAAATDVPVELWSTWMGAPAGIAGLDPDAGVTLTFSPIGDAFWMTQSQETNLLRLVANTSAAGPGAVRLTTGANTKDCVAGTEGTYAWSLSAGGETLTLTAEGDTCAARLAAVPGTYWRMDCPTYADNCLGTLDAGTYASQFIDPFISSDDDWTPRYGALTYTVPADWVNMEDWPKFFRLAPAGASEAAIFLTSDVVVARDAKSCVEAPDPDIGTTAEAITDWLATAEGLVASAPEAVSIGGLEGYVLDLSIDPAWTATCPFSEGQPARHLFTDRPSGPGFDWAIVPGERMRLYLLDLGDDRALMIDIDSPSTEEFESYVDEASAVIESFVFAR